MLQRKETGIMKQSIKKFLFWSPRVLCIIFALFISIFALDVFDGQHTFWETMLALVIHLIPTMVIVLVLIIAWKRELFGCIVFFVLPIIYIAMAWGRFTISVYLTMCTPMLLISVLYFLNWKYKDELQVK